MNGYNIVSETIDKDQCGNTVQESFVTNLLLKFFDLASIQITIIIECILWTLTKIIVTFMLDNSKISKTLTKRVSKLTGSVWVVNVIKDYATVNAFCDTQTNNIFITMGLIKQLKLSENEQVAFLLHEIGHGNEKMAFIFRGIPEKITEYAAVRFVLAVMSIYAKTPQTLFAAMILYFNLSHYLSALGVYPVSRFYEYRADSYAVKYGHGKDLISGFKKLIAYVKKLERQGLTTADENPKNASTIGKIWIFLQEVFSTHPNTYKRIEEAEKKIKEIKTKNLSSSSVKLMGAAGVDKDHMKKVPGIIDKIKKFFQ